MCQMHRPPVDFARGLKLWRACTWSTRTRHWTDQMWRRCVDSGRTGTRVSSLWVAHLALVGTAMLAMPHTGRRFWGWSPFAPLASLARARTTTPCWKSEGVPGVPRPTPPILAGPTGRMYGRASARCGRRGARHAPSLCDSPNGSQSTCPGSVVVDMCAPRRGFQRGDDTNWGLAQNWGKWHTELPRLRRCCWRPGRFQSAHGAGHDRAGLGLRLPSLPWPRWRPSTVLFYRTADHDGVFRPVSERDGNFPGKFSK